MGLSLFVLSLIAKKRAARRVLGMLSEVKEAKMVTRDTGRNGLELRGAFRGRPTMVRICLVWTGCWVEMKAPCDGHEFALKRPSDDMDRDAYQAWMREQDPTWDGSPDSGVRRYLGKWAYLDSGDSGLGESESITDHDRFMALSADLRSPLIAAVDQDRYGSARLGRYGLKLSVAMRIFRVGDPVALIRERMNLAARVLDFCESEGAESTA